MREHAFCSSYTFSLTDARSHSISNWQLDEPVSGNSWIKNCTGENDTCRFFFIANLDVSMVMANNSPDFLSHFLFFVMAAHWDFYENMVRYVEGWSIKKVILVFYTCIVKPCDNQRNILYGLRLTEASFKEQVNFYHSTHNRAKTAYVYRHIFWSESLDPWHFIGVAKQGDVNARLPAFPGVSPVIWAESVLLCFYSNRLDKVPSGHRLRWLHQAST